MTGRDRRRVIASLVSLALAALVLAAGLLVVSSAEARAASSDLAPTFTLPTIYGGTFNLTSYRGNSAVVIEFTSLSCSACQIVEKSLAGLYAGYNKTGTTNVQFISIYIEPSFGDTIPALKAYHTAHNITWTMAQDTSTLAVSHAYAVSAIPVVVIINKQGQAVYDGSGIQSTATLQASISNALNGKAPPLTIVTVSVFALATVAGVTTFFSPCAFPMFPGYMSLFLGLNVSAASTKKEGAYTNAARRALSAGTISALGMMIVFLLIGVALIFAASLIGGYIPYFLVVVGAILIGLGVLLLTNLQYWRIVTPLQNLWGRITGRKTNEPAPVTGPAGATGRRLYFTLFGYGMGYAAAAAGCVAPVILSTVVAGMALGITSGIVTILIFSLTAALLMIGITLLLAIAGQRYVNLLKAYTPLIKKISAAALVIVGVYLIYFYWSAWIAPA